MSINKKKGRHYCYQNPARTIKEMVACCIEEAPGNDAFKVKEKGVIKHVSFFQMHKDVQNLGTELLCMDALQDKPLMSASSAKTAMRGCRRFWRL